MKGETIFEALGAADEKLVQRAGRAKGRSKAPGVMAAAAACLLALLLLFPFTPKRNHAGYAQGAIDRGAPGPYESLDALLSHLAQHDAHESHASEGGLILPAEAAAGEGFINGEHTAVYEGYAYHLSELGVRITRLDGENTGEAGQLDPVASSLLIYEGKLVLAGYEYYGEAMERVRSYVKVYDLFDPASPALMDEFTQSGALTGCYVDGGTLFLLTADGECACGYGGEWGLEHYTPEFVHGDEAPTLGERDTVVLGEPSALRYMAVAAYDLGNAELAGVRAYYGDIQACYFGPGYLAFDVHGTSASSTVYFLEREGEGYGFSARVSLGSLVHDQGRASLLRVSPGEKEGRYRLVGTLYEKRDGKNAGSLFAAEADLREGSLAYARSAPLGQTVQINEIVEEASRQIISWSLIEETKGEWEQKNYLAFGEYEDGVKLLMNEMETDYIDGVDVLFGMGSPYGALDTLIPLGNGLYARYGSPPMGLDLLDLSKSQAPRRLYHSSGLVFGDERYCLISCTLSGGRLGALALRENGFFLDVLRVDPQEENPFTLLTSVPVEVDRSLVGSDMPAFSLMEYAGEYYYSSWHAHAARYLPLP